ncbi:unnamed protein product, partial [Symbiodinium microadriaticum]
MPKSPGYSLTGIAKEWGSQAELLGRLSTQRRLIQAPEGEELKCCNKHVSHNYHVLRPLLEAVAQQPNWELFHLDAIYGEIVSIRNDMKIPNNQDQVRILSSLSCSASSIQICP